MKKLLVIGFFFITALGINAQENWKGWNISLGFHYGFADRSKMKLTSMDNFIDSYNTGAASILSEPIDYLRPENGRVWSVDLNVGGFNLMYQREPYLAQSIARYNNGEAHEINLDAVNNTFNFWFLIPTCEFLSLGVAIGGGMQTGEIKVGYRYLDGSLSYGNEKRMTGQYSFFSGGYVTSGFRVEVGYRWLKISLRAENNGWMDKLEGDNTDQLLQMHDPLYYNATGGFLHSNDYTHTYLPQEYLNASDKDAYGWAGSQCIYGQYQGWTYFLTLRIAPLYKALDLDDF
jgi:hypothetical protein